MKHCSIRKQVLEAIKSQGESVCSISSRAGRRKAAIRMWLYGQRDDVRISTVKTVASILGLRVTLERR